METMNTDDLLVAYKQGRRNFRGMQIEPGGLLFGECLDGADFSESRLTGVSFDHCDLNRTSFRNADISGTGFSCSSLVGADMTDARARGADMWQADLTRACLDGADFGRSRKASTIQWTAKHLRRPSAMRGWFAPARGERCSMRRASTAPT